MFVTKVFMKALAAFQRAAGGDPVRTTAIREVLQALRSLQDGKPIQIPHTRHGEMRIPDANKYDLAGFSRLVTQRVSGIEVPVYVGTHEHCDRWLDRNRGHRFALHKKDGRLASVVRTEELLEHYGTLGAAADLATTALRRVPESVALELTRAGVPASVVDELLALSGPQLAACSMRDIQELAGACSKPMREMIWDVVRLVVGGEWQSAVDRIGMHSGSVIDWAEDAESLDAVLKRGNSTEEIVAVSRLDLDQLPEMLEGFSEWMLFLHPDQQRIVDRDFDGPALLRGVSGSGKTSVLIHRALRLARRYPGERILVITLNPTLGGLLRRLIGSGFAGVERSRVEAISIYDFARRLVERCAPELVKSYDQKSGEDLTAAWTDWCEKQKRSNRCRALMDGLESWERGPSDPWMYLADEFRWIQGGFPPATRSDYLRTDRSGRIIPFPKANESKGTSSFPRDIRQQVLHWLGDWEHYLRVGGLCGFEEMTSRALGFESHIRRHADLRYRAVLVDEVQDLSANELALLASIPADPRNGLFVVGDPIQKVFAKRFATKPARLNFSGRTVVLRKNYRNTRQVLVAADRVVSPFREHAASSEGEYIAPEFAIRSGPRPVLLEAKSREDQLCAAMSICKQRTEALRSETCIASPDLVTLGWCEEALSALGIPCVPLTPHDNPLATGVKLAFLDDVKGFEFRTMILLDISDPIRGGIKSERREGLPSTGIPFDERWRDAFRLYAAMTRAQDELYMFYVQNRTILLQNLGDDAEEGIAFDLIDETVRDAVVGASNADVFDRDLVREHLWEQWKQPRRVPRAGTSIDDSTTLVPSKNSTSRMIVGERLEGPDGYRHNDME